MMKSIASWIAGQLHKWSLASDGIRMTIAAIGASLVQVVIVRIFVDATGWLPDEITWNPVSVFLWFFLCCVCYTILTQVTFGGLTSHELRDRLKSSRPTERHPLAAFVYGESGTSHATMFSFLALASVGAVAFWQDPNTNRTFETLMHTTSLLTVVGAWISNVASFAVQYAREDAESNKSAFAFPDTEDPIWADYVSTAAMVSASLSTGDVTTRTRARRKLVAINTVIAFTFNTVIIALLISAIM